MLPACRYHTHHDTFRRGRIGDRTGCRLRACQHDMVPSPPPLTTVSPSGENDTDCTASADAFTGAETETGARFRAVTTIMKPAALPIATREPSGDQAAAS